MCTPRRLPFFGGPVRHAEADHHIKRYHINRYHGVTRIDTNGSYKYKARIHINGNYTIGTYSTEEKAAIAYNKAVDMAKQNGMILT